MFKHVVKIGGNYYLRRWVVFGFQTWDADGQHWWDGFPNNWTAYPSADAAAAAFTRPKFVRWA